MSPRPPLLARLLLRLLPGGAREFVVGDLEEEYQERLARGGRSADVWFWRQTLGSLGAAGAEGFRTLATAPSAAHLRPALRTLGRSRGFTAAALATLAVTIGATTAVFSVVDGVLLRPLIFPEDDELVIVRNGLLPGVTNEPDISFSDRGYQHFVENNRVFEAFGGFSPGVLEAALTGDGPPVQVGGVQMTASAFEVLDVRPLLGRVPSRSEDLPGGPSTIVLSHGLWSRRYGEDPEIIGRSVVLNGRPRTVIGVMPPGFEFPAAGVDVWVPFRLDPASDNFGGHHIEGVGRLRPGVSIATATADAERLIRQYGEVGYGDEWFSDVFDGTATLTPLKERIVGNVRRPLLLLFAAVLSVLLIACTNVATLFLVRGDARAREDAVRLALGSGRARLVQRVLTESLLIGFLGGLGGLLLAFVATRVLVAAAPEGLPRLGAVEVSPLAAAFTLVVSASAGLMCGSLPALRTASLGFMAAITDGARGATVGRRRNRVRRVLVGTQVAFVVVLVVGSGLLVRSLHELNAVEAGFDAGVLTFRVRPIGLKYAGPEARARFYEQLLDRLRALPGVEAAGAVTTLPLSGEGPTGAREIEAFPSRQDELAPVFGLRRATPGYFEAMGIPIVEGRGFTPDDHRLRSSAILISRSIAERYWPDGGALGERIGGSTVVGIVGDVRGEGLDRGPQELIYSPMLDSAGGAGPMTVALASGGDPSHLVAGARGVVRELDPDLPVTDVVTTSAVVERSLSRIRYTMLFLIVSALVATFLACVGIYGLISYVIARRTTEIGIRRALGATPRRIYGMVLGEGMRPVTYGVLAGLLGSLAVARALEPLLYEIRPWDPLVLGSGSLVLLAVASLAMWLPARHAAILPAAAALRRD